MSGPLASWVFEHAAEDIDETVFVKAGASRKAVVDVVGQLALSSYPDGSSAYAPTWDELAHRTRTSRSTVAAALKLAVKLKLITVDYPGRGRLPGGGGRPTVYRVQYILCSGTCKTVVCDALAKEQGKVQQPDLNRPWKGPGGGRKGPGEARIRSSSRTLNGERRNEPPEGGSVPPGESSDRPADSTPNGAGRARAPNPTTISEEEMEAAVQAAIDRGATT